MWLFPLVFFPSPHWPETLHRPIQIEHICDITLTLTCGHVKTLNLQWKFTTLDDFGGNLKRLSPDLPIGFADEHCFACAGFSYDFKDHYPMDSKCVQYCIGHDYHQKKISTQLNNWLLDALSFILFSLQAAPHRIQQLPYICTTLLTLHLSQHSPAAHWEPSLRAQVVALQHGLVHSYQKTMQSLRRCPNKISR